MNTKFNESSKSDVKYNIGENVLYDGQEWEIVGNKDGKYELKHENQGIFKNGYASNISEEDIKPSVNSPYFNLGKYGRSGNAILKKAAANERFNVNLEDKNNPETKAFISLFEKFYNAGRSEEQHV